MLSAETFSLIDIEIQYRIGIEYRVSGVAKTPRWRALQR